MVADDTTTTDKTRARRAMRFQSGCRMPGWNAAHKQSLANVVYALIKQQVPPSGVIGLYHPLADEVDCRPLARLLLANTYRLALPCVIDKRRPMLFRAWDGKIAGDHEAERCYMPDAANPVLTPDFIVVPLLGFNDDNYRLGRGGGHYDLTLDTLPGVPTVGLAAEFQRVVFTPEPHDCRLDRIVTEKDHLP